MQNQKLALSVFPTIILPQGFSLNLELPSQAELTEDKPGCIHLPSTRVRGTCCHLPFYTGARDPDSGSHASVVSPVRTKPSFPLRVLL